MIKAINRVKLLCCIIGACLFMAGCAGQTQQSDTIEPFRVCVDETMDTLDPATGVGATYLGHLYESLTR